MKKRLLAIAGAVVAAAAIATTALGAPGQPARCRALLKQEAAIEKTLANPNLGTRQQTLLSGQLEAVESQESQLSC